MGNNKPVLIGHLEFQAQKDALAHFREILNRHAPGQQLAGLDLNDVVALLFNHPRAMEKVGAGIKSIEVGSAEHDAKCFHVVRLDGSRDNFSYKKCVCGDPAPFTRFSTACRRAVDDDLHRVKVDHFAEHQNGEEKVRCPETGEWISFDEAHVDHPPPMTFSVIVQFFITTNDIDLGTVDYVREGLYGNEFRDDALRRKFREWHTKNGRFRVIKNSRNLAKAYMGRIKMTKADRTLV